MILSSLCWNSTVWGCDNLTTPSSTLQVAWISKVGKQARRWSIIEVVPFEDIQQWNKKHNPNTLRLLQYLGMKRSKSKRNIAPNKYKIVVMNVPRESLCRPMLNEKKNIQVGQSINGVIVCKEKRKHRPMKFLLSSWRFGLWVSLDSKEEKRSVDVYRVNWSDAAAQGLSGCSNEAFFRWSIVHLS